MSDSRFQGLAQAHLTDMICAQNPLQKLHNFFCPGKAVQDYHCDFAISTLNSFTQAVRSFDLLLRELASSPLSLSMKYYTLALTVDQLDDQECQITSLIHAYRPYCQLYSKQVLKQKHEIQQMLKKFVQRSETFLQQAAHLIDEFQGAEKKPIIVFPDYESHSDVMLQQEGVTILLYHYFTLPRTSDYMQ